MQKRKTLIVGIGASAGGIQALKAFFSHVQAEPDMVFVVVTHLSPNRKSNLHDVIRLFTMLPVEEIKDGDPVRAGIVHVMPEGVCVSIKDGRLRLLKLDPAQRERKPIDLFFSALAIDQKDRAVAIVLSGEDGDGMIGVRSIKDHGGITFAQVDAGNGLRHPEMPESAIASGRVDFALPVEQMPQKLIDLQKAAASLGAGLLRGEFDISAPEQKQLQQEISILLQKHSGRDFAGYKSQTFFRRVARRMQFLLTPTLDAYVDRLRKDPAEVMALFRDLLINVTDFFRDEGAFKALSAQVMPSILANRGADDTIKVWVPACATGEEVYSLVILILENMDRQIAHPKILAFGTDINARALTVARAGRYADPLLKNVSDVRKERFFRRDGASWVIAPELREMCIFSDHSLTSDPPFAQMDLVSCRNLLIYLGPKLQQQVIQTFHYALKPGGFLLLGGAEISGEYEQFFKAVDKKHRIFQSRDLGDRPTRIPLPLKEVRQLEQQYTEHGIPPRLTTHRVRQRAEHQIIERHSPAHVVVRSDGEIIYFSARTGRYFDTPRGAPSKRLFDIVRRGLRQDLRSALAEAIETGKPTLRYTLLPGDDVALNVEMVVEPLNNGEGGEAMFMIVFSPSDKIHAKTQTPFSIDNRTADSDTSEHASSELQELLQSTVERYETTLEELNTSNEELISANEEAHSTNEELQASKEEMQSLVEELNIVNGELNEKIDEIKKTNADLRNLYDATGISSIFLDGDMLIRNFTPAAESLFKLRPSDIGRPLQEIASIFEYPLLKDDIGLVFKTGNPIEHPFPSNGHLEDYLIRTNPYFDGERITGVVVTFFDVTNLYQAEKDRAELLADAEVSATRLEEVRDANARKSRLMAVLAHDLRTPLVAMLRVLDFLRDGAGKDTQRSMFSSLERECRGMLNLIDDVLELSRLRAGEARLRLEPFAPMELLLEASNLIRTAADLKGTKVEVQVESMPMLLGDVAALRRIVLNLATNAVKATRGGRVQLSATLGVSGEKGKTVIFAVSDSGCGIAPEDIPRLFRDFSMLEREGTNLDGTGLGLAICRRLARAMDGEMGVESTPGKGSRFWLKVPLHEADSEVLAPDNQQNPAEVLAGLRVLVAEDHEIIRRLTCAKLAGIGMLPAEAADGEIAVELAETETFDLILLDLQMPRLDGDKAADRIRLGGGPSAQARIIALTAHQPPRIAMMLSDLPFDGFLRKPLDLLQLAALMQGVLPTAPSSTTLDGFNIDNLAELYEIDDGVILSRTLKSLLAEIEATQIELPTLTGKHDTIKIGQMVHKLVGFSDMLGVRMLSEDLRKIEDVIDAGDIKALEAALKWIDDVLTNATTQINRISEEILNLKSVDD